MNKVYLIADTHFGHAKIAMLRGFNTVEEHDETLVENWNATVNKKDTVWLLGDAVFGSANLSVLGRLRGYKKLVLGNHDRYPSSEYLKYFNNLYGAVVLKNFILTHVPVHENQFGRFCGNIHGHTHSNTLGGKYICVSAEQTELRPMPLDKITLNFGDRA